MLKELIKLANHLDSIGKVKEADYVDRILKLSNDSAFDSDGVPLSNSAPSTGFRFGGPEWKAWKESFPEQAKLLVARGIDTAKDFGAWYFEVRDTYLNGKDFPPSDITEDFLVKYPIKVWQSSSPPRW